ncbi:hypothetical protein GCM10010519_73900 [Streptomyces lactacystinicus]
MPVTVKAAGVAGIAVTDEPLPETAEPAAEGAVEGLPWAAWSPRSATCPRRSGAPWSCTHVLDGCGHWIQQERPEEVNRLLTSWLASLQG